MGKLTIDLRWERSWNGSWQAFDDSIPWYVASPLVGSVIHLCNGRFYWSVQHKTQHYCISDTCTSLQEAQYQVERYRHVIFIDSHQLTCARLAYHQSVLFSI